MLRKFSDGGDRRRDLRFGDRGARQEGGRGPRLRPERHGGAEGRAGQGDSRGEKVTLQVHVVGPISEGKLWKIAGDQFHDIHVSTIK